MASSESTSRIESLHLSIIDWIGTLLPGGVWLILFAATYRVFCGFNDSRHPSPVDTIRWATTIDWSWMGTGFVVFAAMLLGFVSKPLSGPIARAAGHVLWRCPSWLNLLCRRSEWELDFRNDMRRLSDFSFPFDKTFRMEEEPNQSEDKKLPDTKVEAIKVDDTKVEDTRMEDIIKLKEERERKKDQNGEKRTTEEERTQKRRERKVLFTKVEQILNTAMEGSGEKQQIADLGLKLSSLARRYVRLHAPTLWLENEQLEAETRLHASMLLVSCYSVILGFAASLWSLRDYSTLQFSAGVLAWIIASLLAVFWTSESFSRCLIKEVRSAYLNALLVPANPARVNEFGTPRSVI